ncbi:MAG: ABC transporter substrate-binding protein [Bifidobacteriaceae bacterium]|jgi:NitT/TauT family transport system substrate-binding protein|nr:ABC transporter substrate-binding protein [Bifidobacteriaceae bacterium]
MKQLRWGKGRRAGRAVTVLVALASLLALGGLGGCTGDDAGGGASPGAATSGTAAGGASASPGQDGTAGGPDLIQVAALKGPTTMGLVQLMSSSAGLYEFTVAGTADEITPGLVSGDIDIALIPANLASVLYNKTDGQVQVAAICVLGVLHVMTKGVEVESLADLADQTVWSTGKGTTPQYVFEYLLDQAGLSDQVTVEYVSQADEVAAKLTTEAKGIGVLPEPYATVVAGQDDAITEALDLTEVWDKVSPDSPLVTGVVVVRKGFVDDRPGDFAAFLAAFKSSTEFTNEHHALAGQLIAAQGITPNATVAADAIDGAHIVYIDGTDAKTAIAAYLDVLYAANPESVGGTVPDDAFYYAG